MEVPLGFPDQIARRGEIATRTAFIRAVLLRVCSGFSRTFLVLGPCTRFRQVFASRPGCTCNREDAAHGRTAFLAADAGGLWRPVEHRPGELGRGPHQVLRSRGDQDGQHSMRRVFCSRAESCSTAQKGDVQKSGSLPPSPFRFSRRGQTRRTATRTAHGVRLHAARAALAEASSSRPADRGRAPPRQVGGFLYDTLFELAPNLQVGPRPLARPARPAPAGPARQSSDPCVAAARPPSRHAGLPRSISAVVVAVIVSDRKI